MRSTPGYRIAPGADANVRGGPDARVVDGEFAESNETRTARE